MDIKLWYVQARDYMGIDFLNNPDRELVSEVICQCAYSDRDTFQYYLEDILTDAHIFELLTDFLHSPNNQLRSQAFVSITMRRVWNDMRKHIDNNIWEYLEEAAYMQAEDEQSRHEDQLYEEARERELYESSD